MLFCYYYGVILKWNLKTVVTRAYFKGSLVQGHNPGGGHGLEAKPP